MNRESSRRERKRRERERRIYYINNSNVPFESWLILKGNPDVSITDNLREYLEQK